MGEESRKLGDCINELNEEEDGLYLQDEIMKNMAEGVVLVRTNSASIVYTNPRFDRMFGYNAGELLGKNISAVNAPGDKSPEKVAEDIQDVLRKTGAWHGDIYNIKKNGTCFWGYANVSTFNHSEFGELWIGVHTDITDRKKAEETAAIRTHEMEVFYKASMGREERIIELKNTIKELEEKIKNLELQVGKK